jgi:O-antigen/teichoic acid export membrane protein
MSGSTRIARNTTYLTLASIIQKVISFGYYAFLARSIGPGDLGKYTFALTFTSVFIIFMDFGLGPLLTREGAKDEEHLQQHVERILGVKLLLMVLSLLGLFVSIIGTAAVFANVTQEDVLLVTIGAAVIILDTATFTCLSIFRALKQLQWEAIGILLYQGMILVCGFAVLKMHLPLPFVIGALFVGSLVNCTYMAVLVRAKTSIRFRFRLQRSEIKSLLLLAAPFAVAGIIYRVTGSADSIMLKVMAGDSYAGWYGLAFKLTFALTVLPGAFATSYFPAMSTYYRHSKELLPRTFESGMFYMLLLSLPIVAGVLVLGDNVITTVWGSDWGSSVEPLLILILGLPFVFLNYPIGNFLNACDRQLLNTMNMGISLVVNIILNTILIPYYTFNGAAISAVASSVVLVCLGLPWVYKIAPFNVWMLVKKGAQVAAAAAIMAFVLYFLQERYHLLVLIGLGILVYGVAIFLVNGITREELGKLTGAFRRKKKPTTETV